MDPVTPETFSISRPRLDLYQRAFADDLVVESYSSAAGAMRSLGMLHRFSINQTPHGHYAYRYEEGRFRTIGRPAFTLEFQPAGRLLEVEGDGASYISIFQHPQALRNAGWTGYHEDLTDAHRLSAPLDRMTLHVALALAALAQDAVTDALTVDHLGHALARCVIRVLGLQLATVPEALPLDADRLRRVTDFVEAELSRQDLTVGSLAGVARVSETQFNRAFKKTCGITPYQFILKRRIDRARHLLSRSNTPLSQVAYEAGFSSQAHLSTAFRRHTGTTPKQFKQEQQA